VRHPTSDHDHHLDHYDNATAAEHLDDDNDTTAADDHEHLDNPRPHDHHGPAGP
jgi:hypothetical protein